jgi:hypothetical protein
VHLIQSTGVLSTACREGGLGNWGSPGRAEVAPPTSSEGRWLVLGVGEGRTYRRNRVTPVEGRTLTLDVLLKKKRMGDWR